ncbi:hypothetical protein Acsp04_21730 [Actinomadura sp. NBRC 104425]|nr:hypothetical protein Acsp04_21730 [Actinomadura sp. NBRC 104425]
MYEARRALPTTHDSAPDPASGPPGVPVGRRRGRASDVAEVQETAHRRQRIRCRTWGVPCWPGEYLEEQPAGGAGLRQTPDAAGEAADAKHRTVPARQR